MLLSAKNLSKSFGGLHALRDVSLTVDKGEIVGVIGPNGAGKTTLFGCLSGFHMPDSGTVYLAGTQVDKLAAHQICKLGLARTFQLVRPFQGLTVLENVMVGAMVHFKSVTPARLYAREVIELLGIEHLTDRNASELGLADLRAMEVARGLATKPVVLLLDEMLAGLTSVEAEKMHERFFRLRDAGLGLLMIEHSVPSVTRLCDKVVVLNFGEVLTQGTADEVLSNRQVQDAYLGTIHE
jgi:ABC-type branched-subunit amino acid transport system ATPase component